MAYFEFLTGACASLLGFLPVCIVYHCLVSHRHGLCISFRGFHRYDLESVPMLVVSSRGVFTGVGCLFCKRERCQMLIVGEGGGWARRGKCRDARIGVATI